jgi:DinB family protein
MSHRKTLDHEKSLRDHLLSLLQGGGAHMSFGDFVADFPPQLCDQKVEGVPYTPWQALEHMRIAQWDILEFSSDAKHISPAFPDGYWPKPDELGNADLWANTIERFRGDLKKMAELVADPSRDLFAKIPHGDGQTILREALLVADHNAYHLGTLVIMSRIIKNKK